MGFLDPKVWLAIGLAFLLGGIGGYVKGGEGPRKELAQIRALSKAIEKAAGEKNARDENTAKSAAAAAGVQVKLAEAKQWAAEEERAKTLKELGGVVRNLADARRVLTAGRSAGVTPETTQPAARVADEGAGADPARRLVACQADLTVVVDTMGVNNNNHESCLIRLDAWRTFYSKVQQTYNGETP